MHSPNFLFLRFLVLSLANPSNVSHCKCFLVRFPFFFQYSSNARCKCFDSLSFVYRSIINTKNIKKQYQEEKTELEVETGLAL